MNSRGTALSKLIALAVVFGLLAAVSCLTSCAHTKPVEDPCKDCPFSERRVPYWDPPELEDMPLPPELISEDWSDEEVEADPAGFAAAQVSDHLTLKADNVRLRHLYAQALEATKQQEPE